MAIEIWGNTFESEDEIRVVAALEPVAIPEPPAVPDLSDLPDLGPLLNVGRGLRILLDTVQLHNNALRLMRHNERVRAAKAYLNREHNPY